MADNEEVVQYEVLAPGGHKELVDKMTERAYSLGVSDAEVGMVPAIKTVDENGVPTEWEAVTPAAAGLTYTMTVTLETADGATVTGQTVTIRDTDASGTIVATSAYSGQPVTFTLPGGFAYYVEASDTMRGYAAPSTATGIVTGVKYITLTYGALNSVLEKDAQTGRYTNASLGEWWRRQRDGKVYGILEPRSETVACIKTDDNAGISNPTPGWVGHPAVDPYDNLGPFMHYDVNGGTDVDGTPYVTSISGIDADFALDGSNGDVWSMAPVRYRYEDESGAEYNVKKITDTPRNGYEPCDGAKLPDETLRPYMLFAKYGGVKGSDNKMHSYSNAPIWNSEVSHNSMITQCDTATTGYSGKNTADDLYLKDMWMFKYASKNVQSVFAGCTSYYYAYSTTVAETGVKHVIIASSEAANLVVGSSVCYGSTAQGNNVVSVARIASIDAYDASNSAVTLDTDSTFDTTVDYKLSTMPWHTGRTDGVVGDGAYSQAALTSGKEPCIINGIELFYGATEVLGNVIVSNDGESGWMPFINHDSRNEATTKTANYVSAGMALPTNDTDSSKYPLYTHESNGLSYGTTTGGSTSVGLCDYIYTNKMETVGEREWQSLGYLGNGTSAGLWSAYLSGGLGGAGWGVASRRSANGRSHA